MKILFYIQSPSTYQIEFYEKLRKYFELSVVFENKNSINQNLKFKKKNWIYFLSKKKSKNIHDLIKKLKPQVIIIGGYKMDVKIKDKSIKKYFWLERVNNWQIYKSFLRKFYLKYKLNSADGVLAIGNEAKKFYKKFNSNVHNIPYSVNLQNKIKNYKFPRFLFVGQMIERKGINKILSSLKKYNIKNYKFTFVGNGPLTKKIKSISKQKKNIKYYKFQNQFELNKIYSQNNILVLPSRYDGWGVVVIEAMSRGMAVISSNQVGASKEYIKHNYNGRIFDIKTKNIDKDIKFFTEDIGKIKLFGEKNRKLFNENLCNTTNVVNKFKKIFNKLKLNESKKN